MNSDRVEEWFTNREVAKNKEALKEVSRSARWEGTSHKNCNDSVYTRREESFSRKRASLLFFVRSRWLHAEERRNISTRSNAASTSEEEGKRKAA